MSSNVISVRYAEALFAAAKEQAQIKQVADDLLALNQAMGESEELTRIFHHLQLTPEQKRAVLAPVIERLVETVIGRNFVYLLFSKGREPILKNVVETFVALERESRGETVAVVTATRELTEHEQTQLAKQVQGLTGYNAVQVETKIDKTILGGLVVRVGDRVYDGSLARRLQKLKGKLMQVQVKEAGVSS